MSLARSARSEPLAFQENSFQLSYDSRGPGRELGRGPGLSKSTKVIGERLTPARTPFAFVHVHAYVQVQDRAASAAAPTFNRQGTYRLQPVVVQRNAEPRQSRAGGAKLGTLTFFCQEAMPHAIAGCRKRVSVPNFGPRA